MTNFVANTSNSALASLFALGVIATAASADDLSKYRNFQLGTDLATVAKAAGESPSQVKTIHSRPALIQELEWHPQPLGSSAQAEPAKDVTFSFYNGELFQVAVDYDRYATEGLTAGDLVDVISAAYGTGAKPTALATSAPSRYGDPEEIVAEWQNSQYRFDLIRTSYGPSFKLVGVLKRLEAPAQAAIIEAVRIDASEAPQREAKRLAAENESDRAKLEKARLLNKARFRL